MKTRLILGAAALALAACGSSRGDDGNQSGGKGATAAAGGAGAGAASPGASSPGSSSPGSEPGVSLQPGEWEMKMEVVNVNAQGLPEGVAEAMKNSAPGGTNRTCMTPEEAKGPTAEMFGKNDTANCRSDGFGWAGGRIQGKTTCTGDGGTGKTVMTLAGSYTPQSIDMTMKSDTEVMGKSMNMEMRLTGRRVGECTAATKEG
jgi:hypothetical protein